MKSVDYLNVTLCLTKGLYWPFKKENNVIQYISIESNHPQSVIKQIPIGVQKWLSKLSANKDLFDEHKEPYQEALDNAGHKFKLEYLENSGESSRSNKRNRRRNILWFNPPFCKTVKTDIGRKFLSILD